MPRAKGGTKTRRRHKRLMKLAEGYYGGRSRFHRTAKEAVDHALVYAYRDRKQKRRDFRQLWQIRISAILKENGRSYSKFIHQLKSKQVGLNRKMLAELALNAPKDFAQLIQYVA